MRIGVNTLFLIPGEVGGSETYLCETLAALALQTPADRLVLFTNRENAAFLRHRLGDAASFEYVLLNVCARNRWGRIPREQFELPLAARRTHLDVLWSPGYTAPAVAPCPQVLSVLDMQYRRYPEDLTRIARWATHVLVSLGVQRARRILTLSAFAREEIVRFTGIAAARIAVTPLAADPAFGQPVPVAECAAILRRLTGDDTAYLLCVANSYPHKNMPALVDAFGRLAGKIPHRLLLVGKPRLGEPALQAAVRALPDSRRVVRLLEVTRHELTAMYQRADLFVFPSRYEGFGLPVLEAMTARVPVVTTRCAAIPEVGGDEVVYSATPDAEGLAAAVETALGQSPTERGVRVEAACRRARTFAWARTAALTRACLAEAVE